MEGPKRAYPCDTGQSKTQVFSELRARLYDGTLEIPNDAALIAECDDYGPSSPVAAPVSRLPAWAAHTAITLRFRWQCSSTVAPVRRVTGRVRAATAVLLPDRGSSAGQLARYVTVTNV